MSKDPVISVRNVSKAYRIWATPARRLVSPLAEETARWLPGGIGDSLRRHARAGYQDFHALENVSFELQRGEAVGIIGRNGAGKSTLLQIIAGTLRPTSGRATIRGRVAALLELGAGFNPDFTGRENVFLSGAVLGLSQSEITARFAEIAAFADIGEFIEQPVKTYSSGMTMRLAFAVNTCVDPDILIVDEALSVGDAPFQAKCFRRLRQLIDKGVSLLFVSHDIGTVRSICTRALWLKNGRAEMWGEAKQVAKEYEKFCWQEQGVTAAGPGRRTDSTPPLPAKTRPAGRPPASWDTSVQLVGEHNHLLPVIDPSTRLGNGMVVIAALVLARADGQPAQEFDYDEPLVVHYQLRACEPVDSEFLVGIRLRDKHGNHVISVQDLHTTHRLSLSAGGVAYGRVEFRLPLTHGDYLMRTGVFGFTDGLARPDGHYDFSRAILWDVREDAAHLTVRPWAGMPLAGPVHVHADFSFLLPS
ncbi:MAG: ABC transporter ATP-binding protein [Lacunisphaera sp.]|nr:ABC transporter ATP-binding protein [Lacunisphaera sp.]